MRIGIVGAGQLGRMLGHAAHRLGMDCRFLDPAGNPPAAVCGDVIAAPFDDTDALRELAAGCDVVTYEFENVPVAALASTDKATTVLPPLEALRAAQDRLAEKQLFERLDIPLPAYHPIDCRDDFDTAAAALGLPMVVKTRRFGYDGKGQVVVRDTGGLAAAADELGDRSLIAEQFVAFDYEVSCIGVRDTHAATVMYPLARNVHRNGILHSSVSPLADIELTNRAQGFVTRMLEHLDYVGVLALELFVLDGELFANEFAPRVHNSGHWSIEGSVTSQFENHLRAVTGIGLGATDPRGHAGMINLIGDIPEAARSQSAGTLHDYGKAPRPGRKLGHVTVTGDSAEQRDALLDIIDKIVTQPAPSAPPAL